MIEPCWVWIGRARYVYYWPHLPFGLRSATLLFTAVADTLQCIPGIQRLLSFFLAPLGRQSLLGIHPCYNYIILALWSWRSPNHNKIINVLKQPFCSMNWTGFHGGWGLTTAGHSNRVVGKKCRKRTFILDRFLEPRLRHKGPSRLIDQSTTSKW